SRRRPRIPRLPPAARLLEGGGDGQGRRPALRDGLHAEPGRSGHRPGVRVRGVPDVPGPADRAGAPDASRLRHAAGFRPEEGSRRARGERALRPDRERFGHPALRDDVMGWGDLPGFELDLAGALETFDWARADELCRQLAARLRSEPAPPPEDRATSIL